MNTQPNFKRILDLIPAGPEAAISKTDLCQVLGMTDRELRLHIHRMRISGCPILTSTDRAGYFMPSEANGTVECMTFIRQQTHRARSIFRSIRGAKAYIAGSGRQLSFLNGGQDDLESFEANEF